jgi:hypothetical protein
VIALCLQTCDRYELTARTLETLAAHNDLSRFRLLHADDASTDHDQMRALVMSYGFRTVFQSHERLGMTMVRWGLVSAAVRRGADWILLLENDIETLRPFPWELFAHVEKHHPEVCCLRLYGRFKDAARRVPCLTTHKRRNHEPVRWRPFRGAPEASQIGQIHWSAQPCVTRAHMLLRHHQTSEEPDGWTVRVKKNVMAHIGVERTPGRVM